MKLLVAIRQSKPRRFVRWLREQVDARVMTVGDIEIYALELRSLVDRFKEEDVTPRRARRDRP